MDIKNLSVKETMKKIANTTEKISLETKKGIIKGAAIGALTAQLILSIFGLGGSKMYGEESLLPFISESSIMSIDISASQENIDWDFVEKNYDYIILKATWYKNIADDFEKNSQECINRNIPFAVYGCNYISYKDKYGNYKTAEAMKEAQREQVEALIKSLEGKKVKLPVFLDFESFDGNPEYGSNYTDEQCCIMLDTWYDMLKDAGYIPGVYTNKFLGEKLKRAYDKEYGEGTFAEKFVLWISGDLIDDLTYEESLEAKELNGLIATHKGSIFDISDNIEGLDEADIIQVSENGTSGFGVDGSPVDVNFVNPHGRANPNNNVRAIVLAAAAIGGGAIGYKIKSPADSKKKNTKGRAKVKTIKT